MTHVKRHEHAYNLRYPDQGEIPGDSNLNSDTENQPTERERQDRIERLAQPNRRLLQATYELYNDYMSDEKAKKIKMTVDRMRPISME